MKIAFVDNGVAIELTGAEARVLLEELGDVSSRDRPKVRQLYRELERALEVLPSIDRAQERESRKRPFL